MRGIRSFSTRLSLNIVYFTSILFVITLGIVAVSSTRLISEEAETSSRHLLRSSILQIEKTLKSVEATVEACSWDVAEDIYRPDKLFSYTQSVVKESKIIRGFGIAFASDYFEGKKYFCPYSYKDSEGNIHTRNIQGPEYNYFYSDWYLLPSLMKEPVWTEPYHGDAGLGVPIITYCYPLLDEENNVYAVLVADAPVQWMADITKDIKPYPNSEVFLYGISGSYISLGNDSRYDGETLLSVALQSQDAAKAHAVCEVIINNDNGIIKFTDEGQRTKFMVFGSLSNGWKAAISCEYREVLKRAWKMNFNMIIIAIFGLVILFIICYTTIRRLTQPLMEFSKTAMSIAEGNFNTALPKIDSDDEVKDLRDSFEHMQTSLNSYIKELQSTTAVKERIQSELNIASSIQMSMLPKNFPDHNLVDIHALLKPAREVGGDLYDFYLDGDMLYFIVGDVSGKGVPAAMFMTVARTSFRFAASMEVPVNEIVSAMNNAACEGNDSNMFVTLFVGKVNLKTGDMEYCNGGHNPVVLVTPDGKPAFMDVKPNLAIGLFPDFPYVAQSMHVESGSRFVLYTDGVTEAERADKQQYGDGRLLAWAEGIQKMDSSEEACESLFSSVKAFVEGNEQNDDITIMIIKIQ